jgi:predicted lysophospholipase L1 biosynthesis ABC-type transport system permease subunit
LRSSDGSRRREHLGGAGADERRLARRAREAPNASNNRLAKALPANEAAIQPSQRAEAQRLSWLLLSVVGMVLLIACADAGGLLMARAERRRRELSIRVALGASRVRIVRQSLTESVLIAIAAAVLGLVIAMWLTDFVASAAPPDLALPVSASPPILDPRTLAFAMAAALVTALLVGLVPALASRPDLVPMLKGERVRVSFGRRRVPLRDLLVAGQMALATLLLVGAGLLIRTLGTESRLDPGFRPDGAPSSRRSICRGAATTASAVADSMRRFSSDSRLCLACPPSRSRDRCLFSREASRRPLSPRAISRDPTSRWRSRPA